LKLVNGIRRSIWSCIAQLIIGLMQYMPMKLWNKVAEYVHASEKEIDDAIAELEDHEAVRYE